MGGEEALEARQLVSHATLIEAIEDFCRQAGIAESTFGKQAVNDGKFVSRLRIGHRITPRTLDVVWKFIAGREKLSDSETDLGHAFHSVDGQREGANARGRRLRAGRTQSFFSPARHAALLQYTNESGRIAERVFAEIDQLAPLPPALQLHYARLDDGRVLDTSLKYVHHRFPETPIVIVARETDYSNTLKALLRYSDRLQEHQNTVMVLTNLPKLAAARLGKGCVERGIESVEADWLDFAVEGMNSFEMHAGMAKVGVALQAFFLANAEIGDRSQHLINRYYIAVIYLKHMRFALNHVIPRKCTDQVQFDLIVASHSYRLAETTRFKAERILKPLVDSLAPGGRLLAVHAHGGDCAQEFVNIVWPTFITFPISRQELITVTRDLIKDPRSLTFSAGADRKSIFDYVLRWPEETSSDLSGPVATELGWMICSHVAQVPDSLISDARRNRPGEMERAVQDLAKRYSRLWFLNESFTVTRRRDSV